MATTIRRNNNWFFKKHLYDKVKALKDWKGKNSLQNSDKMIGLLTTLVREIYTYDEVEFILPKFEVMNVLEQKLADSLLVS